MSEPNVGEQLFKFLKNLATTLARFAKRRAIPLISAVVIVIAVYQIWDAYQKINKRDLTFLMGDPYGPSADEARRIKTEVERGSVVGKSYALALEGTSGYEENRKRIKEDSAGKLVGFAYDGFGESEGVAIVYPLDKRYLHILCRTEFLQTLDYSAKVFKQVPVRVDYQPNTVPSHERHGPTLPEIFKALEKGRVYIGPSGSATRQCAEIVLEHFEKDPGKLMCNKISGIDQLRPALFNGDIDMAFSSTLFSSRRIREIAEDKTCVLLGLNNHRDAIVQENPHLLSVDFKPNSYLSGPFCPEPLEAIGARRVVIGSQEMSEKDAYLVGISTRKAFRDKIPTAEWETPPLGAQMTRDAPLRYSIHPGAELIRNDEQPLNTFRWTNVGLMTVALWLSAEALRWLNSLFAKQRRADDSEPAPATRAD